LRIGQECFTPESSNHSLYLVKLPLSFDCSYPEGNFGENQLPMVRWVFRPYTQVWRSICTSESLRASTRVSPGFTLLRHSSPSFGFQHTCSHSNLYIPYKGHGRWIVQVVLWRQKKKPSNFWTLSFRVRGFQIKNILKKIQENIFLKHLHVW